MDRKSPVTTSLLQQKIDYFLGPLDKTKIPTGVLYDRVVPLAVLDSLSTATTMFTTSRSHFMQAWSELYDASYNTSSLLTPQQIKSIVQAKRRNDTIAIGAINYRFDIIDGNSITNNLLYRTADTLLHDVAGRSQSPYITRQLFLATPLVDKVTGTKVVFQFPTRLLLQNNTRTISSLTVYDGQSQTLTLAPGGSFTTTYQTTGVKTLRFTANFSNGTTQTVQGIMDVTGIMDVMGNSKPVVYPCDPPTKPYKADAPFADYITGASKYGEGEIGYYYASCSNKKILKPIIILDGFDPGDDRDVTEIYGLLYYTDAYGSQQHFGEDMRALGYDVIIVNFPPVTEGYELPPFDYIPIVRDGGADYIERNAFVLTKLIKDINQKLQANGSFEKITIVGPSMGGQISRYALAYLEKTNYNHNCKLWISFDSPHLGANIPIGDQWWIDYYARVAGDDTAKARRDNVIGSVAAKQMLIHHWTSNSVAAAGAPTYRSTYVQNLRNNGVPNASGVLDGYPRNFGIRKIALTNGSGAGRLQQGASCGEVLQMDVYTTTLTRLFRLFGLAGAFNSQVSHSNIYFRPDKGNTCKVFDAWFARHILSNYHPEEKFAQTPSHTTGYDMVPGGKFNTQAEIQGGGKNDAWKKFKFSNVIPNHAFIPTVSALDLSTAGTIDWASDLSNRNLLCSPNVSGGKETPFDSYFTPSNNEDHVFLSAASVEWIKKEITGTPQPPYLDNAPVNSIQLISGYEPICTNTATYQLTGLAPNTAVTWTASPATVNVAVDPANSSIVRVSRISNGSVTLTATASLCGPLVASRYLRVGGYSSSDYPVTGSSSGSCGSYVYFSTNQLPGATSYTWFYPSGWSASGYTTNNLSLLVPSGTTSGNYQVGVRVANACDAGGSYAVKNFYVSCSGMMVYEVSPNPATDEVAITPSDQTTAATTGKTTASANAAITEVNIYDQQGILKKHLRFGNVKQAKINVSNLKTGIYFLEIVDTNHSERHQLSVLK